MTCGSPSIPVDAGVIAGCCPVGGDRVRRPAWLRSGRGRQPSLPGQPGVVGGPRTGPRPVPPGTVAGSFMSLPGRGGWPFYRRVVRHGTTTRSPGCAGSPDGGVRVADPADTVNGR